MSRGRNTVVTRIGRMLQRLPISWLRVLEYPFINKHSSDDSQPTLLFLLAVPRSGSTLTYQLLSHRFHARYLSNLSNLLYQLPFFGSLLTSTYCSKFKSDFQSSQGYVYGLCGQAEGLRFWQYWLDYNIDERQHYKKKNRNRAGRLKYLRQVFSVLSHPALPMINGFLGHSLNPQQLQIDFPEAIFIRLYRDPLSNAMSLLRCRRSSNQDWFSLFPSECESVVGEGEHKEVASQVYWLNRRLDDQLSGDNVFCLDYEELCEDPLGQLNKLQLFCKMRGVTLSIKNEVPVSFDFRLVDMQGSEDATLLKYALDNIQNEHGILTHLGYKNE